MEHKGANFEARYGEETHIMRIQSMTYDSTRRLEICRAPLRRVLSLSAGAIAPPAKWTLCFDQRYSDTLPFTTDMVLARVFVADSQSSTVQKTGGPVWGTARAMWRRNGIYVGYT